MLAFTLDVESMVLDEFEVESVQQLPGGETTGPRNPEQTLDPGRFNNCI